MMLGKVDFLCSVAVIVLLANAPAHAAEKVRIPPWAHNLLVDSQPSGNMESYGKEIRGAPDHMIYDFKERTFVEPTTWSEYGVGAGQDIGVIAEESPVWWMAEWEAPVEVNLIALSGAYPNQPQPDTAWKIELREGGLWRLHERGIGGWYDNGSYFWHTHQSPIRFDAIRVSLFSKDKKTSLQSVHFRGERDASWVVSLVPPIDAAMRVSSRSARLGETLRFHAEPVLGDVISWQWDFGDGERAKGSAVSHVYAKSGAYNVTVCFKTEKDEARLTTTVTIGPAVTARITPLKKQVRVGEEVSFDGRDSRGPIKSYAWKFDDGAAGAGKCVAHAFREPGIYQVSLTVTGDTGRHTCLALVRAHEPGTVDVPQVLLDTDQKNEQDDQHYLGYAVFSELDVLGVNSVHHGCAQKEQEAVNYAEILHVLNLSRRSGAPPDRIPRVFRGANERMVIPDSGEWFDTEPVVTAAAEAILAAARGASPEHPAWVVPVGPGTNVASAILMARRQGLELKDRLKVMWLGGSDHASLGEFNANNDPWSMHVVSRSGIELWIVPAPVGARVRIDKRTEADCYADHPLGEYLKKITPAYDKPLFDPAALSAIIDMRLQQGWIKEMEFVTIAGPDDGYRWSHSDKPTTIRVIRQIDSSAMKADIFDTMKGRPQRLRR